MEMFKSIKRFAVPSLCLTILGAGAGITVNAANYSCTKTQGVSTSVGSGTIYATAIRHTTGNTKWTTQSTGKCSVSNVKSCTTSSYVKSSSDSSATGHYNLMITLNSYASGTGSVDVNFNFNGSKVY